MGKKIGSPPRERPIPKPRVRADGISNGEMAICEQLSRLHDDLWRITDLLKILTER